MKKILASILTIAMLTCSLGAIVSFADVQEPKTETVEPARSEEKRVEISQEKIDEILAELRKIPKEKTVKVDGISLSCWEIFRLKAKSALVDFLTWVTFSSVAYLVLSNYNVFGQKVVEDGYYNVGNVISDNSGNFSNISEQLFANKTL